MDREIIKGKDEKKIKEKVMKKLIIKAIDIFFLSKKEHIN